MVGAGTMSDPDTRAIVVAAARENAHDLYLSALLAPRVQRDDLIVLAAFEGELDRVPAAVSEPMRGEFRLQWWRDLIAAGGGAAASGNPMADALCDVIARHGLSRDGLRASIDARSADLDPGEITSFPAFIAYLDSSEGAAIRRAASVLLGRAPSNGENEFLDAAGRAVALARIVFEDATGRSSARRLVSDLGHRGVFPRGVSGERPRAWLASEARAQFGRARALLGTQSSLARRSALPLALVEPYLRASEGDAITDGAPPSILPLSRVWRLWRLARLSRL